MGSQLLPQGPTLAPFPIGSFTNCQGILASQLTEVTSLWAISESAALGMAQYGPLVVINYEVARVLSRGAGRDLCLLAWQ